MKRKLNKKAKKVILTSLGVLVVAGVAIFTIPRFMKTEIKEEVKEEEKAPVEEKKLKILDVDSNTRPIAVMINNIDVARPYQTGLQDAYMVYEMIVEGGITRMMAVFKDANTAKIGTVRSARHYYLDYALESDAIYVHWGYSEYAMSDISKLGINNVNGLVYGNKYFWKDTSLHVSTEHTAYTSMELINAGIDKLGYRKTTDVEPLLNYSVDEINYNGDSMTGLIPANNVAIRYSKGAETEYTYDVDHQVYVRSVNNKPHVDYDTKEQYTTKNIITYQVRNSTIGGDVKGRQDLANVGSGEGYYITNGFAVPITWEKASRSAKTIYKLKDGTPLKVNDGNTYIQIQPSGEALTIS